jgi:spectinomycin phosphotransferase
MGKATVNDKQNLLLAIQQAYGLEIIHLEFLLRGFGGDCYRVETNAGSQYFLKIHDPVSNQTLAASSRAFYLPLMHQLHTKAILPQIPHPLPTRNGDLSLKVGVNELVITNFIEGELVGFDEMPGAIVAQVAEMVGILHNSLAQLEFEHAFIDQFEIVFEQDLLQSFAALPNLNASATPGQGLLRDLVLPRQDEIIASLHRLKELQAYAQGSTKPKVICHTDLHGGNLMIDKQGNLFILDWENALIAPPEHDLIFFAGEENFREVFWPQYTHQFKQAKIDCDILGFYFYRRGLEDIADFILRILRGNNSPERDQQEIEWMVGCINGLAQIECTLSRLAAGFAAL